MATLRIFSILGMFLPLISSQMWDAEFKQDSPQNPPANPIPKQPMGGYGGSQYPPMFPKIDFPPLQNLPFNPPQGPPQTYLQCKVVSPPGSEQGGGFNYNWNGWSMVPNGERPHNNNPRQFDAYNAKQDDSAKTGVWMNTPVARSDASTSQTNNPKEFEGFYVQQDNPAKPAVWMNTPVARSKVSDASTPQMPASKNHRRDDELPVFYNLPHLPDSKNHGRDDESPVSVNQPHMPYRQPPQPFQLTPGEEYVRGVIGKNNSLFEDPNSPRFSMARQLIAKMGFGAKPAQEDPQKEAGGKQPGQQGARADDVDVEERKVNCVARTGLLIPKRGHRTSMLEVDLDDDAIYHFKVRTLENQRYRVAFNTQDGRNYEFSYFSSNGEKVSKRKGKENTSPSSLPHVMMVTLYPYSNKDKKQLSYHVIADNTDLGDITINNGKSVSLEVTPGLINTTYGICK